MTYLHDTTRISRRRVLAGLGAVGLASAGAGLGTTGFLSDREAFPAEMTTGRLDLKLDYRATYTPGEYQPTDSDGTAYPVGDTLVDASGEARPMYVVGMAPDIRNADGTVVDNATWSTANLALDACVPLADQLPLDIDDDQDPEVFAGDGARDGEPLDNYRLGYVDGPEGLSFALDDVKPCDRGEATISFHVCDNPAYVWLRGEGTESENTRYEPEGEVGDTGRGPFAGGELADFLWVRAFYDPDCSNTLGENEEVMYEGSLAGFVDATADGRPLDPLSGRFSAPAGTTTGTDRDDTDTGTTGSGDLLDVRTVEGNPKCADFGSQGVKLDDETAFGALGPVVVPTDDGDITLTITELKDGSEGLVFDWSAPFAVDRVIVKGGPGANVYVYDDGTSGTGLTTPDDRGISHVSFCYETPTGPDPVGDPDPQDGGLCYDPGTHCIAVEWYLPCDPVQDDGMGFTQLPSDAATTDTPVNGEYPSLADELLATFDLETVDDLDVNVAQSDSVTFTLTMAAVQCRHNTGNDNPFDTTDTGSVER